MPLHGPKHDSPYKDEDYMRKKLKEAATCSYKQRIRFGKVKISLATVNLPAHEDEESRE